MNKAERDELREMVGQPGPFILGNETMLSLLDALDEAERKLAEAGITKHDNIWALHLGMPVEDMKDEEISEELQRQVDLGLMISNGPATEPKTRFKISPAGQAYVDLVVSGSLEDRQEIFAAGWQSARAKI